MPSESNELDALLPDILSAPIVSPEGPVRLSGVSLAATTVATTGHLMPTAGRLAQMWELAQEINAEWVPVEEYATQKPVLPPEPKPADDLVLPAWLRHWTAWDYACVLHEVMYQRGLENCRPGAAAAAAADTDYMNYYANKTYSIDQRTHPVVRDVLQSVSYYDDAAKTLDVRALLFMDPVRSSDGVGNVSVFARGVADMQRMRRTTLRTTKFLRQGFPALSDHAIRDAVAKAVGTYEVWHTVEDIVRAVQEGPKSCMQFDDSEVDDMPAHPYECYAPEYGWRVVVRLQEGHIMGRCLVLHHSRGPWVEGESLEGSVSVRSYKRDPNDGYSYADEGIDAWLDERGVTREDAWPKGTLLAFFEDDHGPVGPWVDGGLQSADQAVDKHGNDVWRLDYGGSVELDDSGGRPVRRPTFTCDRCGEDYDEDDVTEARSGGGSITVCQGCLEADFRLARGAHRDQWYTHYEDIVESVETGIEYDINFLDVNGVVELAEGGYIEERYAFRCPVDDEMHQKTRGVFTVDAGLTFDDNTWTSGDGREFSDNTDLVTASDGELYPEDECEYDEEACVWEWSGAGKNPRAAAQAAAQVLPYPFRPIAPVADKLTDEHIFCHKQNPPHPGWWNHKFCVGRYDEWMYFDGENWVARVLGSNISADTMKHPLGSWEHVPTPQESNGAAPDSRAGWARVEQAAPAPHVLRALPELQLHYPHDTVDSLRDDLPWRDGAPPLPGWWVASTAEMSDIFRYWTGERWCDPLAWEDLRNCDARPDEAREDGDKRHVSWRPILYVSANAMRPQDFDAWRRPAPTQASAPADPVHDPATLETDDIAF